MILGHQHKSITYYLNIIRHYYMFIFIICIDLLVCIYTLIIYLQYKVFWGKECNVEQVLWFIYCCIPNTFWCGCVIVGTWRVVPTGYLGFFSWFRHLVWCRVALCKWSSLGLFSVVVVPWKVRTKLFHCYLLINTTVNIFITNRCLFPFKWLQYETFESYTWKEYQINWLQVWY